MRPFWRARARRSPAPSHRTRSKDLPLSGRNYFDIALFVPGVSPTNTAANQLFAETSDVPGQGISVGSQRNFSNSFIIDGVSANDDAAGVAGTFIGLDVVQEFQVVTSGGQAELGRALGGYVNVVTKSGGNTLHGDVYGYFRNSRFNAANALSNTVLPLTQAQYGASLSGPMVHDKTFYFANFEARDLNQSGLVTIAPANVATINARLAAVGFPGPLISTGDFRNPVHNENFFAKVDHHFSDTDQFSARYSLYHVESINSRGAGGLSAPSASANLFDTDQTIAASNVLTLSSRMVNETRDAVHQQQSCRAAFRSRRTGREHFGRGFFRHAVRIADGARQPALRGHRQPFRAAGRERDPGRRRLSLQRRHHHVSAHLFAAAMRSPRSPTF